MKIVSDVKSFTEILKQSFLEFHLVYIRVFFSKCCDQIELESTSKVPFVIANSCLEITILSLLGAKTSFIIFDSDFVLKGQPYIFAINKLLRNAEII